MRAIVTASVALTLLAAPAAARPRSTAERLDRIERLLTVIAGRLGVDQAALAPEPPRQRSAAGLLADGRAAFQRADFTDAAELARQAVVAGAGAPARHLYAVSLFRLGRYAAAATAARAALDRGHLTAAQRAELTRLADDDELIPIFSDRR